LCGGAVIIKQVKAEKMMGSPFRGGSSQSRYIWCTDGDGGALYNVKFRESDQGWKMPINELVASQVALAMGVPMPEIALVELSEIFLEANPQLSGLYDSPVKPGLQFGSKFVDPCDAVPHPHLISLAENSGDFPRIVVFDVATNNSDRCDNNYDNVLLVQADGPDNKFRLLSIDHGACFGNTWGDGLHKESGKWCGSVMPEMVRDICVDDLFRESLHAAKTITCDIANSIVSEVPLDWGLSGHERLALALYVSAQASKVIAILVDSTHRFPGWGAAA
jgi:hypothetical protein